MAVATANKLGVEILIVSEPNIRTIRGRKDWVYGDDFKTAIKLLGYNEGIKDQGQGHGFTYVAFTNFTIFSCYCSGNADIEDLEESLQEIQLLINDNEGDCIIAGDFNAKSPQWGMNYSDTRGQVMTEWIAANNLIVINQGEKATFEHQNYGSILDLTISTENIRPKIIQWEVLEDESLSDHKYILFKISDNVQVYEQISLRQGWQVKKLDRQKLNDILDSSNDNPIISTPKEFTEKLNKICDKVMPKKKSGSLRKPNYWWNNDIALLRKQCHQKRREYTRNVRRLTLMENQIHWDHYMESKRTLRNAIKKSKRDCWKKLCEEVDRDIWGDGYKIAMKGMLGFPPKLNLNIDKMKEVTDHLFPIHEEVRFTCDRDESFINFTKEELLNASMKLKTNKAPGPSNIPPEIIEAVALQNPKDTLCFYNELAKQGNFPIEWKKAELVNYMSNSCLHDSMKN
ncbi:uncharacterized protein [Leptinotarsa decemlineata]|uniref:uncharacterized protein n=1 Tax=Leptinotarsa decemlineata TaxID=7539 RepID=UPI003D307DF8